MSNVSKVGPSSQSRPNGAPRQVQHRVSFGPPSNPGGPSKPSKAPAPPQPPKKKNKGSTKHKLYDPRDHKDEEDDVAEAYVHRRRPVIFILCVGIGAVTIGIGATWYGDSKQLRDFLVIGPGVLIIGVIMVLVAVIIMGKDFRKYRKRARVDSERQEDYNSQSRKLAAEYFVPKDDIQGVIVNQAGSYKPVGEEIYKENGVVNNSLVNGHEKDVMEIDKPTLAQPNFSKDANDGAVYHVTLPTVSDACANDIDSAGKTSSHRKDNGKRLLNKEDSTANAKKEGGRLNSVTENTEC